EAFDKGARVLGLSYPGGPAIEDHARAGDPKAFDFPRPLKGRPGCDFSFSGLKAAIKRQVDAMADLNDQERADLAASYQQAIADCLADRVKRGLEMVAKDPSPTALVIAGGVAANGVLRSRLTDLAAEQGLPLIAPPMALCTDNGAMVAWAGLERLALGLKDRLDISARPRWPLDQLSRDSYCSDNVIKNSIMESTG
ncbi:MAG: tRNA (adenosine(37)-N6)-threonylcarbamoyltransferase complex transferase subunit TsaD, partial [Pseudomonadota bacterium]